MADPTTWNPGEVYFVEHEPDPAVPKFLLLNPQPDVSDLVVIDARVPLGPLFKALAAAGFTVINDRTGKLVVTCWPDDFKSAQTNTPAP